MNIKIAELCDYALIDQDHKLSIMGIFNDLRPNKYPAKFSRIYLVFVIEQQPTDTGKHKVKIMLNTPNKEEEAKTIGGGEFDIEESNEGKNASFIIGIGDILFSREGKYEFAILIDDEKLCDVPLRLATA